MTKAAKQAHRNLALFIGIFILVHFAAHFSALAGIEAQGAVMRLGRNLYQLPIIEVALVLALFAQVVVGVKLLRNIAARKRKDWWHKVQFASGCYLAMFITVHTAAAVTTRLFVGLDTNFYWAAGTLLLAPLKYTFTPYYILAVTALASHILAALHFRRPRKWHGPALIAGPIAGAAIVMAYSGAFYDIALPSSHLEYFSAFPGVGG